jgi:hypothetical protein
MEELKGIGTDSSKCPGENQATIMDAHESADQAHDEDSCDVSHHAVNKTMGSYSEYGNEKKEMAMDSGCNDGLVRNDELGGARRPDVLRSTVLAASGAGSVTGVPGILARCIATVDSKKPGGAGDVQMVDSQVEAAVVASALSGFRDSLRKARGIPVDGTQNDLAATAAVNDLAAFGRLLGPRDVNRISFNEQELPESLLRRPLACSPLDVAVGSGSVEMTKYLLEFHHAKPTRETLEQSLSAGNLELIKLMRERLPGAELEVRVNLMEIATEFHQHEVLAWLLRDATAFEFQLLVFFALERKLADPLMVAPDSGLHPWLSRAREVALEWRASSQLEFMPAPEGFSSDGGRKTDVSGVISALPVSGSEAVYRGTQTMGGAVSSLGVAWTATISQELLGTRTEVKSIVFPAGITAIGKEALQGFVMLESVVFPLRCISFGRQAFADCKALKVVAFPAGCKATGDFAFYNCSSLASVVIPVGCKTISDGSFCQCVSLTSVKIPSGCTRIDGSAFAWSSLKQVVIPGRCEVGRWAFSSCRSLTRVTVGTGCKTMGSGAFSGCTALASVTLPSTLKWIGDRAFEKCPVLATLAIPKGCEVHMNAFQGSKVRVTEL